MDPSIKKPSGSDSVETMKASLTALGLPPVGKKDTLFKRLKRAWHNLSTSTAQTEQDNADRAEKERVKQAELETKDFHQTARGRYKAFLVLDIEGTCESGKGFDFPNEVIEFPVVLVRWRPVTPASLSPADSNLPARHQQELYVHDTFQTYIKPVWRPKLTKFVTSLTGITQDQVDDAPTFSEMLPLFLAWLKKHGLGHLKGDDHERDWLWVTDGPFDLRDFIAKQAFISKIPHPWYLAGDVLDLKDAVASLLKREWEDKGGFDAPDETDAATVTPPAPTPEPSSTVELGQVVEVTPPMESSSGTIASPLVAQMDALTVDEAAHTTSSPGVPSSTDPASSSNLSTTITTPATPQTSEAVASPTPPTAPDPAPTTAVDADPSPTPTRNKRRKGGRKGKPSPPSFFFNVTEILRRLGLGDFEGRPHSGIDDARNIARILIELERRGILIEPNRFVRPGDRKWAWMGDSYRVEWGKVAQE